MKKIRKLTAAVLGLILGTYAFSYKIYAEDNIVSTAEDITWDIQNVLDISECAQDETVTLSVYLHGSDESKSQDITVMSGILEYDNSLFTVEKLIFCQWMIQRCRDCLLMHQRVCFV